jgi:hypothetical protein
MYDVKQIHRALSWNFTRGAREANATSEKVSSILMSVPSVLRGLSLFVTGSPRTLLRVLCIAAFDTLYALRHSKRLPLARLRILAALLDFGACANAALDNKGYSRVEFRAAREILEGAGLRSWVREFLRRLQALEARRPSPVAGACQFQRVASYREAVVRLALGTVAATAMGSRCIDEGIRATYYDEDLAILFRIVMQCQIIDDVLDYSTDLEAGLPSFLTGSASLPLAMKLAQLASSNYAEGPDWSARGRPSVGFVARSGVRAIARDGTTTNGGGVFSLRIALSLVSACAKLVLRLSRWRLA